jgi:hypothetical protein
MADIDGDGEPELIAGKRYRAMGETIPARSIPWLCTTTRSIARREPSRAIRSQRMGPPLRETQFVVEDLDGDGDLDIATAGKTGVHFFENLNIDNVRKAQREKGNPAVQELAIPRRRTGGEVGARSN